MSAGPWQGLVGEVELVGAVRCQVRVDDDELVSVPLEAVRVLPASAAAGEPQQPPLIGDSAPDRRSR